MNLFTVFDEATKHLTVINADHIEAMIRCDGGAEIVMMSGLRLFTKDTPETLYMSIAGTPTTTQTTSTTTPR